MAATIDVESTLTDRYQTTVPETVRRALRLGKRDKIHFTIHPGGQVVLSKVEPPAVEEADPVLESFLGFLAHDLAARPEQLRVLGVDFAERLQALVAGVEVDLDAELLEEDE